MRGERRSALKRAIGKDRNGAPKFNAKNRQKSLDLARLDLANHLWVADPRPKGDAPLPRTFDVGDRAAVAFDNGRMNILADSIMADPWYEISEGIDDLVQNKQTAREVKKGLASHGWCNLLVALIQLIEKVNKTIGIFTDAAKRAVQDALSNHLTSRIPEQVKDAVAGIVVDKVWSALTRLLEAHFPSWVRTPCASCGS
ncbi:hypothetical protein OHQ88_08060 [Micromonospora zamorensis]|uniref:hypothetical protein n=1 Tax=Micromonospora zamorensis TaxID=709883 RepID=UPI002E1A2F21|nr:hypothetical protein OG423_01125 [Micromonospora zamorensis]